MRQTLVLCALFSCVLASGCQRRDSQAVVPDRANHAEVLGETKPDTYYGPRPDPRTEEYYKLQPGENLYTVQRKYGVSVEDLLKRNEIEDKDSIKPGMLLIVPRK